MTTSLAANNDKTSVAEVEIAKHEAAPVRSTVAHYVPATEEEKALDRRVNLKFDLCIIVFLSLGFIVSCYALSFRHPRTRCLPGDHSFWVLTRQISDMLRLAHLSKMPI
jgi:hypothetical protein